MNIDYELGIIIVTIGLTIIGAKIIGEMQFQRYKKNNSEEFPEYELTEEDRQKELEMILERKLKELRKD